jgi:restriction system protein
MLEHRLRIAVLHKGVTEVDRHIDALARKRLQTIRLDAYGKPIRKEWEKELAYFFDGQVVPSLSAHERKWLESGHRESLLRVIEERVNEQAGGGALETTFDPTMTPAEYERHCAAELQRAGWHASVTKATGDQGVDVIAEKESVRIVIQCKLYGQPVGNKAVQEVFSAKAFESAQFAAVVSNREYTKSAETLAAASGVLLLHHSDLSRLDDLIRVARRK